MSQTQSPTFGVSTNSVTLTLPHRWSTSPTPLTLYQSYVLDSLRRQLDNRLPNSLPSQFNNNTAREVFELQYLGLVDVLNIEPPRQGEDNWQVNIEVCLTLEGYFFISQAYIIQRLIEYVSPIPTLHTHVRHIVDHSLVGRVTRVYPSGKLRVKWAEDDEHDIHSQFVERYK